MGKRRAARELALKFLYQSEFNSDDCEAQIEQFVKEPIPIMKSPSL